MHARQIFLLTAAIGLTPIAISYGAAPQASLQYLLDLSISEVNEKHIFRAIMGLYLALVVFWILGVFRQSLQTPALYSLVVFMLGLAAGRVLSLIVDGMPHLLLLVYLLLELAFGTVGVLLLRQPDGDSQHL